MFSDYLISPVVQKSSYKLGKTIALSSEGFEKMLTFNEVSRRFSNPWLVNRCRDRLQKYIGNADVNITQIHVERSSLMKLDSDNRQLLKVDDDELLNADISNIVGRRAIIKMEVKGFTDEFHPAVAISLSELDETVAIGGSVNICSNFTIFSKDNRFFTHSRHSRHTNGGVSRMTTDELLKELEKLFPKTEERLEQEIDFIEDLKKQQVSEKQWNAFVGQLFSRIHYVNRKRLRKEIAAVPKELKELPITSSLLADVVAEAIEPAHSVYNFVDGMTNKWNCINYGTEQIKTEHGHSPKLILEANSNWTELVLNHHFGSN